MLFPRKSFPIPINPILHPKERITAHLKYATQLERPRYFTRRRKEPEHFHQVTRQPAHQHRHPEPSAGTRLVVRIDLWEG